MEVAGANRRWRCQIRCRGSRRESAVAQLSTLGIITRNLFVSSLFDLRREKNRHHRIWSWVADYWHPDLFALPEASERFYDSPEAARHMGSKRGRWSQPHIQAGR